MAKTPEGKVKDQLKAVLNEFGIWFYMPVHTGWGVAGIPDFVCCWGGDFLGIEAKAPGMEKNLSKHQKKRRDEILGAGGLYLVVSSGEQLREYLEPLRRQDDAD